MADTVDQKSDASLRRLREETFPVNIQMKGTAKTMSVSTKPVSSDHLERLKLGRSRDVSIAQSLDMPIWTEGVVLKLLLFAVRINPTGVVGMYTIENMGLNVALGIGASLGIKQIKAVHGAAAKIRERNLIVSAIKQGIMRTNQAIEDKTILPLGLGTFNPLTRLSEPIAANGLDGKTVAITNASVGMAYPHIDFIESGRAGPSASLSTFNSNFDIGLEAGVTLVGGTFKFLSSFAEAPILSRDE